MKKTDANFYRDRKIFLFMTIIAISCYILIWILDWNFDRTSTSLFELTRDNVSEIKIFNGTSSQESLLVTLNSPKDDEIIYEFVRAIDNVSSSNPPSRELILSHGLYLVINLNNSNRSIEFLLHLHEDCRKTVYIDIIKKIGRTASSPTFYRGGARSEFELYEWLESINLLHYLGCS
jgi:hypothetical protein